MRLFVVGCVTLLIGIVLGVYGARAASTIKYSSYLAGKDVPAKNTDYMYGYVSGTFDTLMFVTWIANDDPKSKDDFTPAYFAGFYQCLQKIPNAGDTVAWAKGLWAANPDLNAANLMLVDACQYQPGQAKSNTMTGGGSAGHTRNATLRSK